MDEPEDFFQFFDSGLPADALVTQQPPPPASRSDRERAAAAGQNGDGADGSGGSATSVDGSGFRRLLGRLKPSEPEPVDDEVVGIDELLTYDPWNPDGQDNGSGNDADAVSQLADIRRQDQSSDQLDEHSPGTTHDGSPPDEDAAGAGTGQGGAVLPPDSSVAIPSTLLQGFPDADTGTDTDEPGPRLQPEGLADVAATREVELGSPSGPPQAPADDIVPPATNGQAPPHPDHEGRDGATSRQDSSAAAAENPFLKRSRVVSEPDAVPDFSTDPFSDQGQVGPDSADEAPDRVHVPAPASPSPPPRFDTAGPAESVPPDSSFRPGMRPDPNQDAEDGTVSEHPAPIQATDLVPAPTPDQGPGKLEPVAEGPAVAQAPTTDPETPTTDPEAATTDPEAATTDPETPTTDPEAATTEPRDLGPQHAEPPIAATAVGDTGTEETDPPVADEPPGHPPVGGYAPEERHPLAAFADSDRHPLAAFARQSPTPRSSGQPPSIDDVFPSEPTPSDDAPAEVRAADTDPAAARSSDEAGIPSIDDLLPPEPPASPEPETAHQEWEPLEPGELTTAAWSSATDVAEDDVAEDAELAPGWEFEEQPDLTPALEATPDPDLTPALEATPDPDLAEDWDFTYEADLAEPPELAPGWEFVEHPDPTPALDTTPDPDPTPALEATPDPDPTPALEATPDPDLIPALEATPDPDPIGDWNFIHEADLGEQPDLAGEPDPLQDPAVPPVFLVGANQPAGDDRSTTWGGFDEHPDPGERRRTQPADTDARGSWIPPALRGIAPDAEEAAENLPRRRR